MLCNAEKNLTPALPKQGGSRIAAYVITVPSPGWGGVLLCALSQAVGAGAHWAREGFSDQPISLAFKKVIILRRPLPTCSSCWVCSALRVASRTLLPP
jgi:hypothetical protein